MVEAVHAEEFSKYMMSKLTVALITQPLAPGIVYARQYLHCCLAKVQTKALQTGCVGREERPT